ncbi:MAG: hypothetical protein DBY09_06095 [Selenomonadales bacterium]|jgi:hypothetical protein|nr:hypothetical protein [Clostridiales bacterium]PWL97489.1 MAG: hypothetical protein DBY09_06095 [Selenomonadales bacterium]
MKIVVKQNGVWYHGSDEIFSKLKVGSTITQWKELAEAFSHKPTQLSYDDNGIIKHNGVRNGYLYVINEPIEIGADIYQHPNTSMDEGVEFLTKRALKVKMIEKIEDLSSESN